MAVADKLGGKAKTLAPEIHTLKPRIGKIHENMLIISPCCK